MLVLHIIQIILACIAIYMANRIWIGEIKSVKLIKKVSILSIAYLIASFVLLLIAN